MDDSMGMDQPVRGRLALVHGGKWYNPRTMKILATADLHYDIARSREPAGRLAREVCAMQADALVLVGDTGGINPDTLVECLRLFDGFSGQKFLVPGNHCLWCRAGEDSLDRYHQVIPQAAASAGFSVLDRQPAIVGNVGLVGSIGWYDYSMVDGSLGIPLPFYHAKLAPGAAAYLDEPHHRELLAAWGSQLGERQMSMGVRWMDGQHVHLTMSDEAFTAQLADTLQRQIDELAPRVDRIVAFLHHLAFREQVPPDRPDRFAFAAAYLGSVRLGEILLASPKVTNVFCGHSHWGDCRNIGHLSVVNIGSTYVDKKLEVLEL